MSLTIELPDEVAAQLAELPEKERRRFAVGAISSALEARRRDSQECFEAVEEALADMEAGRNLIPFEDVCARWDAEKKNHGSAYPV